MPRPKKEKEYPKCPICGGDIKSEPYRCNFETFAGRAGWHMSFYPKINMCQDCSDALLASLERWFATRDKTGICKKFSR